MDVLQGLDGFQFNNQLAFDNQIKPVQADFFILEENMNLLLVVIRQAPVT